MRSAPRKSERRGPRALRRRAAEWLDEVVPVERLPPWMRQGCWVGPAPSNLDCIDAPSGAEAFMDPNYEEPAC
jgi:hypothetical protein